MKEALVYKIDPRAKLPERKSEEAAGYDLHCIENFTLKRDSISFVRTGLVIQPPPGYHFEILPRSGLAAKYGIMLANNVGLIDRDYSGPKDEVIVMLYRVGGVGRVETVSFQEGERIGQLVFRKTEVLDLKEVDKAPKEMSRGGLGSTGTK